MFLFISFPAFSPSLQHKALVDSGAAGSFMDRGLTRRLGIQLVPIDPPFPVHSEGRPLGSGLVREATIPLDMVTHRDHRERISFLLIDSPAFLVVLRVPWLAIHNPLISWKQGALQGGSHECSGRCIGVSIGATTVESPDQFPPCAFPQNMPIWLSLLVRKKRPNYHPIDGGIA